MCHATNLRDALRQLAHVYCPRSLSRPTGVRPLRRAGSVKPSYVSAIFVSNLVKGPRIPTAAAMLFGWMTRAARHAVTIARVHRSNLTSLQFTRLRVYFPLFDWPRVPIGLSRNTLKTQNEGGELVHLSSNRDAGPCPSPRPNRVGSSAVLACKSTPPSNLHSQLEGTSVPRFRAIKLARLQPTRNAALPAGTRTTIRSAHVPSRPANDALQREANRIGVSARPIGMVNGTRRYGERRRRE